MTTKEFHQIASCASMMAELAKDGEEMSNAIKSTNENIVFQEANNIDSCNEVKQIAAYANAKSKIEERLKAKNEELQKIIIINEMFK